jgi:hypothetical protein
MPELVAIASGLHLEEAYLARARLEGSGIYCFLANEFLVRAHPHYFFAAGGVELRVMKHDVPAAIEVLTGKAVSRTLELDGLPATKPSCPKCSHLEFIRSRSGWRSGLLLGVLALLCALFVCPLPLPIRPDLKICKACGHRWK